MSDETIKTPLQLRAEVLQAREQFGQGTISETQLYAVCDAYIESIKAFKKRTGNKKLPVPTRGKLLRSL